ncbi:Tcp11-domain-containing protein [Suhomyces tanzawaensis NRRL Y-17324]|uniref:Tcp11-domain-containing protein n=1 Tax=Suhomyces tanzawaensis NRRL Y-17324 TaxID=984487 RepID=A0A1E4SR96_9ASCO|nr:Tcp11-domain-containing protein [Suhomyces tanzawaensis NRRL Y-17324]ODV82033.1 Tcp11-domain-containing protein [Suhomyces tanzawaensis NRRL Y-17324]
MMNSHMNNQPQDLEQVFLDDHQFRQVCFDKSPATANPSPADPAGAAAGTVPSAPGAPSSVALASPSSTGNGPHSFKRNSSLAASPSTCLDQSKRARLDPSLQLLAAATAAAAAAASSSASSASAPFDMPSPKSYTNDIIKKGGHHHLPISPDASTPADAASSSAASVTSTAGTRVAVIESASKSKAPKLIRRFRSRSLPIINYNSQRAQHFHHHGHHQQQQQGHPHSHHHHHHHSHHTTSSSNISPLPPINLQSLKEIDLHEILKNPQLRHDILFDPQLQFRPNLDGERGKRKKSIIDKYWLEILKECGQFFKTNPQPAPIKIHRLPILFTTLRDILLSLLPTKDRQQVNEIMDIELLIQQLNRGSFDFVEMSKWLGDVFKSHCAPMRDQWVVEMHQKFVDAYTKNSVDYLVGGLRMIFQILEAMKLDVANHQIRILRPVLIETAVDFERDYFQSLINHQKININDSLNWFYKKFVKKSKSNVIVDEENQEMIINDTVLKPVIVSSIIDLLSCRQMATEFPSTLAFDHTRLVLLRADVRQLVCVQLCVVLFKQLVLLSKKKNPSIPSATLLAPANILKVQQQILAIVTDDNGNIKWTKNISSISLQLVKNVMGTSSSLPPDMVDFSYNWLIKHIQPSSEVYGLMEGKIFKDLLNEIVANMGNEESSTYSKDEATSESSTSSANNGASELKNIAARIATLVRFHWNVFGNYYIEYVKTQQNKLQQDKIAKRNVVVSNSKNKLLENSINEDGNSNQGLKPSKNSATNATILST